VDSADGGSVEEESGGGVYKEKTDWGTCHEPYYPEKALNKRFEERTELMQHKGEGKNGKRRTSLHQ